MYVLNNVKVINTGCMHTSSSVGASVLVVDVVDDVGGPLPKIIEVAFNADTCDSNPVMAK